MTAIPPVGTTANPNTIPTIAPITPGSATPSQPPQVTNANQMGQDTFLKLLVAQLKYQNPMAPTDPSTFMSQSAQFSMLEKLTEMAKDQKTQSATADLSNATAMIGKQVSYTDGATTVKAVVTSIKVDPTNGPSLNLSNKKDIPLSSVVEVDPAPAS